MEPDDIGAVEQRLAWQLADVADRGWLTMLVATSDVAALLREFAALRRSYEQRGEAIERIAGTWKE